MNKAFNTDYIKYQVHPFSHHFIISAITIVKLLKSVRLFNNYNWYILLFALFISVAGLAQNSDSTRWNRFTNLYDNPYKSFKAAKIVGIQNTNILSANRVSNDFIYPFVFGKKLEKEAIDNNLKKLQNKQFSIETNTELSFINLNKNLFNNKAITWYLKGGTYRRLYTDATNDAMRLVFKGNTDTNLYNFSNCNFSNLVFNKLGGGLYYRVEKATRPYNLSFGLFITQTLNYASIKTYERNYLQGNEDSFDIGINYDAEFASANAFSGQGLGLSSEILFNQKINNQKTWGFRLENFGFATFNKKATTYNAYGTYKFDGVFITDLGRLSEAGYFKSELDSFTNQLTNKKENQSKTVWIAPSSFIYYNIKIKSGYYQIALRHYGTRSLPVAELRYFTFVKPTLILGFTAGTIGSNYLNTDISWAIHRKWFLQAGIYHLEALVLPKYLGGLGANFGLQHAF